MSEGRAYVTAEEAEALLPDGEEIHTFRGGGAVLIGADWPRAKIIEALRKHKPELTGPMASGMGHGLYLEDEHGGLFIATKKQQPETA